MREILFRGKTILNEWVYGDLRQGKNCNSSDKDVYIMFLNNTVDREFCNRFVFIETVGQYTGLTDKYGTKIFEGDIILVNGTKRVYVFFENGQFVINHFALNLLYDRCLESEVIGNIHDNPELLETE